MAKSLQDIIKERQQEEFVGRGRELAFFHRNLRYKPDDDRRRFIISVSGPGGVGKTWLLRRFHRIAEEAGAVTARTADAEDDIPSVMGRVAEQFATQDHPLKNFVEQYKVYRQRREEIAADPEAPQGLPTFLGRTLVKGGLHLARRVPVGGVVADLVDEEPAAALGGDFAAYVARKIRNRDDVRLVLEPVEILTPLLLAGLRRVAEKHLVILFFDTYERVGDFLDPWLRNLLEGRYGDVPVNILLVVAGRNELDRNHWAHYEGLLVRLSLDPFTEAETRDYLTRREVTDEQTMDVILNLSGRLPLLVATLAAGRPDDPSKVGDPSGDAVERFLKWVEDPQQRQVALDAALPRQLNRDVLAELVGEKDRVSTLFDWLKRMPFVGRQGEGWAYHDVVRSQILRYKWYESPRDWADTHGRLSKYYETLQDGLGLEETAGHQDEIWSRYELESLYHHLCQAPQAQLAGALNGFLVALKAQRTFAYRWAEIIECAGKDVGLAQMQEWGRRLWGGLRAYDEARYREATEMFTVLLERNDLEAQWRAIGLAYRGVAYQLMKCHEEALTDFDQVIELSSDYAWTIARRGMTYRHLRRYEEALVDFDRAIELNPDFAWAIANRGVTYRKLECYKEALADFNRTIELNPDYTWAIVHRGQTYRRMKRYEEALADFNRVIDINPDDAQAIADRGETCRRMKHYWEALADFDQSIELNPNNAWVIANRGETYRLMKWYEEALTDFKRAIELNSDNAIATGGKKRISQRIKGYKKKLVNLDRAIKLHPDDARFLLLRGEAHRKMRHCEKALVDFNQAIEMRPDDDQYRYNRALAYQALGQTDRAQADLTIAIQGARQEYEKAPHDWHNTLNLALYHLAAGEEEEAESLYRKVLSGGASSANVLTSVRDLGDLLILFPNHPQARAMRDLLQEHLQEAKQ